MNKDDLFALALAENDKRGEALSLARCNEISERFGLSLTAGQMGALAEARHEALKDSGRVDFGGGVLPKLVYAFCDSPYISRDAYFETLTGLQNLFYYYKSESADGMTDDEIIESMAAVFNSRAGGELEYLASLTPDELCERARRARYGEGEEGDA